ncbi:polyprenyl synthetase family protein [Sporolactobacillus sp. THM7-7]|nr:polyprenyl synthetase family protein [Sporolactobacillus sp. THM7-7]
MTVSLDTYMKEKKAWIDRVLPRYLNAAPIPEKLKSSMSYSLMAGGKRIRPILLFATLHALGTDEEKGLCTAAGLEMIHSYSLIHDDLPAMDDDDLRRGKPTNHKVFGEATAILAGDGLLTLAFQVVASDRLLSGEVKSRIIERLSNAAGPEGMVGGQQEDLEAEEQALTIDKLMSVHRRKTGRLIRFPVEAGALIGEAAREQYQCLTAYADHLGLAFQIGDDILDITGSEAELGKTVGSDLTNHKNTYVSLLTLDGARKELSRHVDRAIAYLGSTGLKTGLLEEIAAYLLHRTH